MQRLANSDITGLKGVDSVEQNLGYTSVKRGGEEGDNDNRNKSLTLVCDRLRSCRRWLQTQRLALLNVGKKKEAATEGIHSDVKTCQKVLK